MFDQRHETAVPQGSVRPAKGEVVRESGNSDREVGGQVVGSRPEVAEVGAGGVQDREARDPGCVEACCADDGVDVVRGAALVDEAMWMC